MCNLYTNKSTVAEMADLFRAKAPHGFNAPAEEAMALVRKYPADRLTVERTADPWFKKKGA